MYKVTGLFRGSLWIRYRKTAQQAKKIIADERYLGSVDLGMERLDPRELRLLRRGK
jgi:hypothetical protein